MESAEGEMEPRTEPTFAFGEIGGGELAAVLQADVALRSASRTHAPSLALGAGFDYGPYGPSENKNHLMRGGFCFLVTHNRV